MIVCPRCHRPAQAMTSEHARARDVLEQVAVYHHERGQCRVYEKLADVPRGWSQKVG